ncbi:MAG: glycosyltransferase [Bacteroidetes bacterium]|nr:glycosyltransferase [Bacteroidota bacterium]
MTPKLNIIILGTTYPFRGGGLATYNERLAKQLQDEGNKVVIYTFSLQYPNFLFPGKSQYSDREAPKNLDIHVKVNSINPFNWIKVGKEINKLSPDILFIRYWLPFMAPCFGTIALIAKKNKKTKVLCIADNIIPHEKRIGDFKLTNYFVKAVDGFIAMSKSVINDLNLFDKNIPKSFCPHPLYDNFGEILSKETALNNIGLDPQYSYLLFFGFIRAYKGLDILLHAFADERLRKLPIKLIIAGEFYEDSKPYLDLIDQLHLREYIVLKTDFIPDNDVKNYFCAVDLVVQPYKNATQSGVTQICYHFNKPMLVTNVGGLSEIVPNGIAGYVVEANPKDIADQMLDFYENNKAEYFIEGILREKQKYQWSRMTACIYELYNGILKK